MHHQPDLQSQGRALTEKAVVNLEQGDDMRLQRSVEAGLASAQARNLPEATSSKQQDSSEQTNEPSTSSTLHASPQKEQTKADMSSRDVDQPQEQPADYGKGSTMSDEDKQKAAVGSIK